MSIDSIYGKKLTLKPGIGGVQSEVRVRLSPEPRLEGRGVEPLEGRFQKAELIAELKSVGFTAEDFREPSLQEQVQALPVGTKFTLVLDSGDEYKHPYIKASLDEAVYLNPDLRMASVVRIASNFAAAGHINITKE